MVCPYCREEIKSGAAKCKHCGSMLVDLSVTHGQVSVQGGLVLPSVSLTLSVLSFLMSAIGENWSSDGEYFLYLVFCVAGLIAGIVSVFTKPKGKGMAIAGIAISSLTFLLNLVSSFLPN